MAKTEQFVALLSAVQEYISQNYAAALTDKSKFPQLKSYIEKYLYDKSVSVSGFTNKQLVDALYCEMAEYSVLTKYLGRDEIEEINVNGWDDIAVTYTDGHIEKAKELFFLAATRGGHCKAFASPQRYDYRQRYTDVARTSPRQHPCNGTQRTACGR